MSTVGLKYMDPHDKDWITLSTDQELEEALSLVNFEPPVLHMELFLTHLLGESEIKSDHLLDSCHSEPISHVHGHALLKNAKKITETSNDAQPADELRGAALEKCLMDIESNRIEFAEQGEIKSSGSTSDVGNHAAIGNESVPVRTSRTLDDSGGSGQASLDSQFEDVIVIDDRSCQVSRTDEALARLMDMGFENTAQLHVLLRLHGGDVDAVLEALLSG